MKKTFLAIFALMAALFISVPAAYPQVESNRKERKAISEGNEYYNQGHYRAALQKYQEALTFNPNSAVGHYNLGLSQIRLGTNPSDTSQAAKNMLKEGLTQMQLVSKMTRERPALAARANYNLGNIAFESEDYRNALNFYKQSLRLNPDDEAARRNLRITQLKLQNQSQDKDQNQDQNKEEQEKEQNQDQQQQQQDQQQPQQQNQEQQQQQQQQQDINRQTADQILKAMENKENQTRARVNVGQGDKSTGKNRSRKNW